MVGRVGKDSFGQELLQSLQSAKIHTEDILVDGSVSSGVALIAVDQNGENTIIMIPGANGQVNESDIKRLSSHLTGADSLLLQLEIPIAAVKAAAQAAQKVGVRVILDPAPAQSDLPIDLYPLVDILTPNEIEAEQLVGFPVESPAFGCRGGHRFAAARSQNRCDQIGGKRRILRHAGRSLLFSGVSSRGD